MSGVSARKASVVKKSLRLVFSRPLTSLHATTHRWQPTQRVVSIRIDLLIVLASRAEADETCKLCLGVAVFLSTRHAEKIIRKRGNLRLLVPTVRRPCRCQRECGEITQFESSFVSWLDGTTNDLGGGRLALSPERIGHSHARGTSGSSGRQMPTSRSSRSLYSISRTSSQASRVPRAKKASSKAPHPWSGNSAREPFAGRPPSG